MAELTLLSVHDDLSTLKEKGWRCDHPVEGWVGSKRVNGSRGESKATILVVDDDQDIRFIVARTLEKMGHKVLAAATGAEAVQAVEDQTVDLALVDIKMPKMGGRKTIEEIRKLNPQLPIILLTGSPDWPSRELRAATQGCIYKPFRLEQLRTTVRKVLEKASKADADSGTE